MRISGEEIAEEIREELRSKIENLKSKGIVPKIAIITLGDESSWQAYVRQKIKVARELRIKAVLITFRNPDQDKLLRTIQEIDKDPNYHGIIVQRPMPKNIDRTAVVSSISPEKDIDGFRTDSKFEVPVWLAVKHILRLILKTSSNQGSTLIEWLKSKNIVVVGKGETAGGPVARTLRKLGVKPQIIDSRTQNPEEILKSADVIISCVGKGGVVRVENIKKGSILVGVGTHREDAGLRGDYNEQEIEQVAGAYTSTPGGVGPVNLSYLFSNLVEAAAIQNHPPGGLASHLFFG